MRWVWQCFFSNPSFRILFKRLSDNHCRLFLSSQMHTVVPTTSDCATNVQKSSVIGPIGQPIAAPESVKGIGLTDGGGAATEATSARIKQFPTPPSRDLCCGSGCPNCVWIQFADEVMDYVKSLPLHDGVEKQQKKMVGDALNQNVEDENLRVYLLMEIQAKGF
ncbi:hypothetical protein niasHT_000269 [Heterodera trifolii]|uniref:Oxidoreductase-like domain-containing protein n=1 Tax=Heterodera trifolii TaxID=157864 RepID=A0ABD2LTM8_9BILA